MCRRGGFTDPRALLPGGSPGTLLAGKLELWSSNLLGVALEEVAWGCPVPVPVPWPGLWEELGFPTQPSPACLSHPGQGEPQQVGKIGWKLPACPRAELCPKAAPSAWANGARTTPKYSRAPQAPSGNSLGCTNPNAGTPRGEGARAGEQGVFKTNTLKHTK